MFDILALFGARVFAKIDERLKLFRFFKMVRVRRLAHFIQIMNMPHELKALFTFLKLIFYLLLYLNIQACLWYVVVRMHRDYVREYDILDEMGEVIGSESKIMKWYPPLDYLNYNSSVFFEGNRWEQYLTCFYHSALLLGINEMGPVNESEMAFCSISILISLVVNANLFSEMAVLIARMDFKKTMYQNKLDTSNAVMERIELSWEQQELIREYLNKTQYSKDRQEEFD